MTKAVILFSGGLDSTVMLALALQEKKSCYAISFSYGQLHHIELDAARKIAKHYQVPHSTIDIKFPWNEYSALTSSMAAPTGRTLEVIAASGVPSTYVPARNTLFLSYAAGVAEMMNADEIHFGCNLNDQPNYPDCHPNYLNAFQMVLNHATKQAVEGHPPKLCTPLTNLDKKGIVALAKKLNVPIDMTWSCYKPQGIQPCRVCDACVIRQSALSITSGLMECHSATHS